MESTYIVVVDDDYDDLLILRTAFASNRNTIPIKEYHSGQKLLEDIEGGMPPPCLFVIDLNMPALSGLDLITLLKANPDLGHTPIITFSTGVTPKQREIINRLGIESFKKPDSIKEWERISEAMIRLCRL